jgi:hypothetical protein
MRATEELIGTTEAATVAETTGRTIRNWATQGVGSQRLPAKMVAGRLLVDRPGLIKFLKKIGRRAPA